jgi:hypothetical protein
VDVEAALTQRASRVASILEANWSEEFAESLAEEDDAPLGFALARCLTRGWIEPGEALKEPISAAEAFIDDNDLDDPDGYGDDEGDDDE